MINWNNLDQTKAFKVLSTLKKVDLKKVLTSERINKYEVSMAAGLAYNFAAKQVDDDVLGVLQELAEEQQLIEKYQATLDGEVINTGEKRMVLHHLLRGQLGKDVIVEGRNLREFYVEQQEKVAEFANKVRNGEILSSNGSKFTTVVQIGIGGSYLGPEAVYYGLENWAKQAGKQTLKAYFISNVDPDDTASVLEQVELDKTLFILVSKSGTTQETLANEQLARDVLKKNNLDPAKHFVAVTSETSPLANNPDYLASFYMDDFIGGRYSVSSPVGGVLLSLAFGPEVFEEFLQGASEADKSALESDIRKNAALMDALIGIYERNFLSYPVTAVLPYSQALKRLSAHLQQLDMESNGKSVNRIGEKIYYKTGPVIFGEPGTNGQHSFYQLLHQGTDIIPLQFIGFKENQSGLDLSTNGSTGQEKLRANLAAQIVAFACGKNDENLNKNFEGERPSSLIYGEKLTPETIGALIAHLENKVMFQGFVWNVNSFDQEGVQLGKKLTDTVLSGQANETLATFAKKLGL